MTQELSGYIRAFEAHSSGITLYTDSEMINLEPSSQRHICHITNNISCCHCKKNVKKFYGQPFCFPCSQKLAKCDLCVLKPELCHYQQGTCREPSWGEQFCMIPHIVYLAWTSDIKVGLSRKTRLHTRWREQGALFAAAVFETKTRHEAGIIEAELKKHYKDQTSWKKMLSTNTYDKILFFEEFKKTKQYITNHKQLDYQPIELHYTIHEKPIIKSLHNEHDYEIDDCLIGIKGHYLLFKTGIVSVRKLIGTYIKYKITSEIKTDE